MAVKKVRKVKRKKKAPKAAAPGRRLKIVYEPVEKLKEWAKNPRVNDGAAEKLAELMGQYGFVCPIIATPDRTIRAGHTRLKAAQKAGLTEVPVIYVDFASEEEAELFALADNKAGEWASWDEGMLADLFDERRELGDEQLRAMSGFSKLEIEGLTNQDGAYKEEDLDGSVAEVECPKCGEHFVPKWRK